VGAAQLLRLAVDVHERPFCAIVPNLRIMEIDPDVVPW